MENNGGAVRWLPAARVLAIGIAAALVLVGTAMGEITRDGLVAEYLFEGDAKDSSGNGNDGTIFGATFVADDNVNGKALSFNGNDNYVEIPYTALENLSSGTIIARIKLNSNNEETIIAKQHDNVGTYGVFSIGYFVDSVGWANAGTPGKLYFHGHNPVTEASSSSVINTGQWYHVAVVFTDTYAKFYIDGSPSNTLNGDYSIPSDTTTPTIGAWLGDGGGRYFDGIIDEVSIYNRPLSENEIKASYEAMKSPSSQPTPSTTGVISMTGPVAEYHFDGDARDSSGNGNDGTIQGGTFVDGKIGKALLLDGISNRVDLPNLFHTQPTQITFEAWVKSNNAGPQSVIYNGNYESSIGFGDGNKIGVSAKLTDHTWYGASATWSASTGTWYYIDGIVDLNDKVLKLYINGNLEATEYLPVGQSLLTPACLVRLGAWHCSWDNPRSLFGGIIDEVRIYNRALSSEEIKANYDSIIGKTPATTATKPAPALTSSPVTPAPTMTIAQTVSPAPAPTAAPESSNSYVYAGIGGLVLILVAIVALKRRSSSKVEKTLKYEPTVKSEPQKQASIQKEAVPGLMQTAAPGTESSNVKPAPMTVPEAPGIYVKTAFGYKGATIIYKVKIENNTVKPISDIKVDPYVPNVFLLKEKEKSISLIEPRSSQTVTFEIRPTGECGDCNVSGRVNYYDTVLMERKDIQLESKSLSIVCPMLHRKEITEDAWRDLVSGLVKAEETTTDVPVDGEGLFGIISDILKDLNLFMLPPGINKAPQIFRGTARFYGEGVKGLRYAAQIEVVGGARKSKLILKAWAEREDALTGFYHGVLDEIEKRVKVKEYINDSIVQYNVHIGDKIGTLVKDSVVQRSNIGASARKCPNCGREVEANEKFCLECGAKL